MVLKQRYRSSVIFWRSSALGRVEVAVRLFDPLFQCVSRFIQDLPLLLNFFQESVAPADPPLKFLPGDRKIAEMNRLANAKDLVVDVLAAREHQKIDIRIAVGVP